MILHIQEWIIIKVAEEVDVRSRWMIQDKESLDSRHVLDSMKWMSQTIVFTTLMAHLQ